MSEIERYLQEQQRLRDAERAARPMREKILEAVSILCGGLLWLVIAFTVMAVLAFCTGMWEANDHRACHEYAFDGGCIY